LMILNAIIESGASLKSISIEHNALGSQAAENVASFFSNEKVLSNLERVYIKDCGWAIRSAK
ncbi:MAG: hypothetical protein MHPSP_002257, partial [Paramarteilia canceri]